MRTPAGKRSDTLVTIGLTAVVMVIWFLLSIVMHSEGNAIYYVLAGMVLVGIGWWFWSRGKS